MELEPPNDEMVISFAMVEAGVQVLRETGLLENESSADPLVVRRVPAGVLAAIAAFSGATGAILAALLTGLLGKLVGTPFLGARDKQDREVEWRKHALELTKLELERKLRSGRDFKAHPLRPSLLDFLANYRDLQELGKKSPAVLYAEIVKNRIKAAPLDDAGPATNTKATKFVEDDG